MLRVRLGVPALPSDLDPHRESSPDTRYVQAAVFDALTSVDERGKLQPALATSWKPLGPTAWEFKLRQGVRFQNGEEFTGETVSFNVRRVLRRDVRSKLAAVELSTLFRSSATEVHSVVISTRRPDPILPRRVSALYMLPPEYVQRVGDQQFGRQPVGTGPWKVARFVPGDELTLEASKGSWRGAPQVRFINVKRIPDPLARTHALVQGETDGALDLPPDLAGGLGQQGFQVRDTPISVARLIVLNTTLEQTPLVNEKVRQALNYAVDKESLVKKVGAGIPLQGQVVGREANGYSDQIKLTYPHDPGLAQRLMTEAGFPDGFELPVSYTNWPDEHERKELNAIANDVAKIKVKLSLRGEDRATHLKRRLAGSLSPAFYDTFPYYPTQDASSVMDYFGLEKTESVRPTYDVEDFEEIYKLTRTEQSPSLRRQALQMSMQILSENPPALYLYQPVRIDALQRHVAHFKVSPNLLIDFDRLSLT